jgi:type IX secretion system substrate protein
MKTNLLHAKASFLTVLLMIGTGLATMAASYTASTTGNWSSSTTWGGTAPSFNITGADVITIPLGVTVTLDNALTINNAGASLAVVGSLTGTTAMTLTSGTLSGTGTVTLSGITVGTGGWITSVGTINVAQFANSQATLALGALLNVSNTIALNSGVLQLNTGAVVTLANGATINMAGGSYSIVSGLLTLAGSYNVLYSGTATAVGLEASLVGLQNVTVNLPMATSQLTMAANLAVAGTLTLTQGMLSLNGNSLTINGAINTATGGSILGSATSNILVNGTGSVGTIGLASTGQTINNLTLNIGAGGSVSLASNITVGGALSLSGSSLNLNGYNLDIAGTVSSLTTGSIIGNSNSNVTVSGTGPVGTLTFNSSGNTVGNLTVNTTGLTGSVLLGSNVIVSGTLALSGGSLNLNGQSLTVSGTVTPSGTGAIIGNIASNITFNGIGSAGTLVLATAAQTINNLTINIGSTGNVALGSNLIVGGTLTLAQGNINIGSYDLTIPSTGSLQGGSLTSYVITPDTGSLIMTVVNAGATGAFQVGTLANYAPVSVTNNSTLTGAFSVIAHPGVFAQGTIGTDISLTQPVVNTSWEVSSSLVTGVNVNLQMLWNTSMQVNAFDNTQAYISHYTGGAWNTSALAAATAHAGGTYSLSLSGVTSFSPFAVFDRNTATAIEEVKANTTFTVYPNPANNVLQISVIETGNPQSFKVFDMLGNQLVSQPIENAVTLLDISHFSSGVYFVSLNNATTTRFIKE